MTEAMGGRGRRARVGLAAFLALAGLACGDTSEGILVPGDVDLSIDSVVVEPPTAFVGEIGARVQFTATALDTAGVEVPRSSFTWRSSDQRVATVDRNGLATALAAGQTEITASVGQASGSAFLTVSPVLTPNPAESRGRRLDLPRSPARR
ncbi:MAG TPA: Ig-like domain-containing protein [Longimicrobiales bacterium]|nr:Ig-like domain-containing protein [Longimicrobiales bacterium]